MAKYLLLLIIVTVALFTSFFFYERASELAYCEERFEEGAKESDKFKALFSFVKSDKWKRYVTYKGAVKHGSLNYNFIGERADGKIFIAYNFRDKYLYQEKIPKVSDKFFLNAENIYSESCKFSLGRILGEMSQPGCYKLTYFNGENDRSKVFADRYSPLESCHYANAVNEELLNKYHKSISEIN